MRVGSSRRYSNASGCPAEIGGEHGRDPVDDRVAPAGKRQVGEAHRFLASQRPPAEGRLCQRAEDVVTRVCHCAVELLVEIRFEAAPFESAVTENVRPPADPDALRLRGTFRR